MARTYNASLREGFLRPEFFVTKTTERLAADIVNLESELKAMRSDGKSDKSIRAHIEAALFEIQSRHWANNRAIKDKAEAELADVAEKWKRKNDADPARALLERQRFEARFKLMSDNDLIKEAEAYDGEPKPELPDRLEVLALEMELREKTREAAHVLQKRMKENDYTSPWRLTPEGDALVGTIQAHDTDFGILKVSPDGGSLAELPIEELINTEIRGND